MPDEDDTKMPSELERLSFAFAAYRAIIAPVLTCMTLASLTVTTLEGDTATSSATSPLGTT